MSSEPNKQDNRQVGTEGGTYIEGGASTGGGDVVDSKITNYYSLDMDKITRVIEEALPKNDPTPKRLRDALKGFKYFHTQLFEWKELHNFLNDILIVLDQFSREVERLDAIGQSTGFRTLTRLWYPISRKVVTLLTWSKNLEFIAPPLKELEDGSLQGPEWALELHVTGRSPILKANC